MSEISKTSVDFFDAAGIRIEVERKNNKRGDKSEKDFTSEINRSFGFAAYGTELRTLTREVKK